MGHNYVAKNKFCDYIRETIRQAIIVCFQVQSKCWATVRLKMFVKWKNFNTSAENRTCSDIKNHKKALLRYWKCLSYGGNNGENK